MTEAEQWTRAFALQARTDLDTYFSLARLPPLPPSQRLHSLQMACEKLCKAYEYHIGADSARTQASHVVIRHNLPLLFRAFYFAAFGTRLNRYSPLLDRVKVLARQIEVLAPAVAGGGQLPENCEYPWRDTRGVIHVPALHSFALADDLDTPAGRAILKVLIIAVEELTQATQ